MMCPANNCLLIQMFVIKLADNRALTDFAKPLQLNRVLPGRVSLLFQKNRNPFVDNLADNRLEHLQRFQ